MHSIDHNKVLPLLMLLVLAFAAPALAQEQDVLFQYDQPSDEMDFDLPPLPDAGEAEAPTGDAPDPMSEFDRFFSSAPVLEDDEEPAADTTPEPDTDMVEEEPKPKKRFVRRKPAKPPFQFKSVILPSTIYKKQYDRDNEHLPIAQHRDDMDRAAFIAAERGDIATLRALKRLGTDMQQYSKAGEPSIVAAARYGQYTMVEWLLTHGAEPDAMNQKGLAAIHFAAYRNDANMIALLIEFGANPYMTDGQGNTPMAYAERRKAGAAKEMLEKYQRLSMQSSVIDVSGL